MVTWDFLLSRCASVISVVVELGKWGGFQFAIAESRIEMVVSFYVGLIFQNKFSVLVAKGGWVIRYSL